MNDNWTVKQVGQLTGLTVRTLHHYDQIGLLKPAFVAENGYRYYNQENLARLQEILLFRELDFPLKDIQQLLDVTEINRQQVLRDHITLLELKKGTSGPHHQSRQIAHRKRRRSHGLSCI